MRDCFSQTVGSLDQAHWDSLSIGEGRQGKSGDTNVVVSIDTARLAEGSDNLDTREISPAETRGEREDVRDQRSSTIPRQFLRVASTLLISSTNLSPREMKEIQISS